MSLIGVRELREQTSEVIRRVRPNRAEYVVTYQGRPVAVILPLADRPFDPGRDKLDSALRGGDDVHYRRGHARRVDVPGRPLRRTVQYLFPAPGVRLQTRVLRRRASPPGFVG